MSKKEMTQEKAILSHLLKGNKITPLEALRKFGCFRLAARIHSFRREGWDVQTKYITSKGKTFAEYSLNK